MSEIYEIEELGYYASKRSGIKFQVRGILKHSQDCSKTMIYYKNCIETEDYPANTKWVISEEMFLRRFKEWEEKK